MKTRLFLPSLMMCIATTSFAAMTMTTNVTSGQTISGVYEFTARVQSDSLVSNVEFYVNGDLRSTDESTPYQFKVDTIEEKDGNMTVGFHAYNSDGESVKKDYTIRIDNGVAKGAKFHIDRSNELTTDSKFDDAIVAARIALKIDSTNNDARMAMARANFGKGIYDIAQKFAEDVIADDASHSEALSLLTAITLKRAFSSTGSDALDTIRGALKKAAAAQGKVVSLRADRAGIPTDENLMEWADTMLAAHRYSIVASEMKKRFDSDTNNTSALNRMLYAHIRSGRYFDALKAITLSEKFGAPDGYTYLMKAIAMQATGDTTGSEEAEQEALLSAPGSEFLKYGQTYLSLIRARKSAFASYVNELMRISPNGANSNYYKAVQANMARDFQANRNAVELSLLANPGSYDMLVERGNEIIESCLQQKLSGSEANAKYTLALAYFEAGQAARTESFEALTGMSIAHNLLGNTEDAVKFGEAASRAAPAYASGHLAYASALRSARRMSDASAVHDLAEKADPRLQGRSVPDALNTWSYFYSRGRIPLIPAFKD